VDDAALALKKRKLSPKVLAVAGVSGIGLGRDKVVVYLEEDSDEARRSVRALVEQEEPGTPLAFEVTGAFRKL
jgi:hypothetical protein